MSSPCAHEQRSGCFPDHGARIKAVETLLREGLGRVGEAEIVEPRVPKSVEELRNLSTAEPEPMVALGYAAQIRAVDWCSSCTAGRGGGRADGGARGSRYG